MKKEIVFFMIAVIMMTACNKEQESVTIPEKETVMLTFTPYDMEAMTRAATSIARCFGLKCEATGTFPLPDAVLPQWGSITIIWQIQQMPPVMAASTYRILV